MHVDAALLLHAGHSRCYRSFSRGFLVLAGVANLRDGGVLHDCVLHFVRLGVVVAVIACTGERGLVAVLAIV